MLANPGTRQRGRRGIVLILVLGMLGLLALIGVTFATYTGQSRIGARNYAQSTQNPVPSDMMDFALAQLIGDTDDVRSAIRGHSMARDMFGNDAANNGLLSTNLSANVTANPSGLLQFSSATVYTHASDPLNGLIQCVTNIPVDDVAYYGYDFTRWHVKFLPGYVPFSGNDLKLVVGQTYEILYDASTSSDNYQVGGFRTFYIPPPALPPASGDPNYGYMGERGGYRSPEVDKTIANPQSTIRSELAGEYAHSLVNTNLGIPVNTITAFQNVGFILDGRYLRAFNGPGMAALAKYGNFKYNGGLLAGNASEFKGDPNVVGMDEDYDACDLENWFLAMQSADGKVIIPSFHRPGIVRALDWTGANADSQARILRPRTKDGHDAIAFPDLVPDPSSGRINLDVDNDGDGTTDSVWVDLGYPPRQDSRGQLYKPMFAFMVIGLNGRIPLNTAGNLQLRANQGVRLYMNASHLGNSPSEVDPTYALQNFSGSPLYSQYDNSYIQTAPTLDPVPGGFTMTKPGDAAVTVNLTQLRNLLTGTRPPLSRYIDPSNVTQSPPLYGDANFALVNGQPYYMPNNVPDAADYPAAGTTINRPPNTVSGRWGEAGFIPSFLVFDPTLTPNPVLSFSNLIRAGLSGYYKAGKLEDLADARDDNFNAYDFWPSAFIDASRSGGELPGNSALHPGFGPWPADYFDAAGDHALPAERARRFVTPTDVEGDGTVVNWSDRSDTGADAFGRVAYNKYFRPAGVPRVPAGVTVSDRASGGVFPTAFHTAVNNATGSSPTFPDITNNPFHGYDAARNPNVPGTTRELDYAGAPADLEADGTQTVDGSGNPTAYSGGKAIPTYNQLANTLARNLNINEADEMRLYKPTQLDDPYGHGDLEWLYREQDRDGGTLHSRLADLAPISFTNPVDGLRRRRLFSVDTWETNSFAWTPDNPSNVFPDNSRTPWPTSANIGAAQAAGLPLMTADAGLYSAYLQGLNTTPVTPAINSAGVSLAHRDRKINLNYPLPVSNDPDEHTRNKWITEAYHFLKHSLPPLSVKYPEQLAQLSQFLINVIDFRDPDATMTHWRNPDLVLMPATTSPTGPAAPYLAAAGTPGGLPFDQYGTENNPVAINEVLAFSYSYNGGSNPSNRFFIELVNTLTSPNATSTVAGFNPSALNLAGFNYVAGTGTPNPYEGGCWDLVFTADDAYSRPDPFRGDLVLDSTGANAKWYGLLPLTRETFGKSTGPNDYLYDVTLRPLRPDQAKLTTIPNDVATSIPAPTIPTVGPPTNYFYVIGNKPASPTNEQGIPDPGNPWPQTQLASPSATTPDIPNVTGATPPTQAASMIQAVATSYDPLNATTPPTITSHPGILPGSTDTGLPANYKQQVPQPGAQTVSYYWVCLRRPANPFAPVSANNPMIVVDSVRFPYIEGTGALVPKGGGVPNDVPAKVPDTSTANTIYSVQRFQPYRGGHAVPYVAPPSTAVPPPPATRPALDVRYGYTDQIAPPGKGTTLSSGTPLSWSFATRGIYYKDSKGNYYYSTGGNPPTNGTGTSALTTAGAIHTLGWANETTENWDLPVFNDRDFTSVAELTLVPGCPPGLFTKQFAEVAPTSGFYNTVPQTTGTTAFKNYPTAPVAGGSTPSAGSVVGNNPTYPYLPDQFFYTSASLSYGANSGTSGAWDKVDGPTNGGWYKMLEFFEVPSSVFGTTAESSQGSNYDWYREDTRPGMLNLNLIIDEEVFLALMGNAGHPADAPQSDTIGGHSYPQQRVDKTPSRLNANQINQFDTTGINATGAFVPLVVTESNPAGNGPAQINPPLPATPAIQMAAYPVSDSGFFDTNAGGNHLKGSFVDFLKLRHGGSGYLFGPGPEAPFRSLTFPDIHFTVMRPAFPPAIAAGVSQYRISGSDAGVKYYNVFNRAGTVVGGTRVVYPPPIPPRRLFQIPDDNTTPSTVSSTPPSADLTAMGYNPLLNPSVNNLSQTMVDLSSGPTTATNWLAGNKQHPFFRSEWMQKITNLATVRTHQYAVWITVGFFEVTRQGDPTRAGNNPPFGAYDVIGQEIGVLAGKNVRYRGFFIVDRLKLTGFDPSSPGKYRDAVLYRTIIE